MHPGEQGKLSELPVSAEQNHASMQILAYAEVNVLTKVSQSLVAEIDIKQRMAPR
jgi:hypothetical protein